MPITLNDARPLDFSFGLAIGAQYYRAPTPRSEDWARDLDTLRDHGMNVIKIWAQWRWNHVEPDRCDLLDLEQLMELASGRGLRVVINTIFDITPSWLLRKHPDCHQVRADGRRVMPRAIACRQIGGVPGPCHNHPEARDYRDFFLRSTVERFKDHPALWFWDLWNEPELTTALIRRGAPEEQVCYCEHCAAAFLEWLRNKYGSLEYLNRVWARRYRDWDEVELPRGPEVYVDWIDWRLFHRDVLTAEMRRRTEICRSVDANHPAMCHTVPHPIFNFSHCASDDWRLAAEGDLFGNSSSAMKPITSDLTRSAARGKPIIASEIHALPGSTFYRPTPIGRKKLEREILTPLFRGIKGFLFWQFRPELLGREAPAWGMTKPDGSPEPWLAECRDLSHWLQEHASFLVNAQPDPAKVAIIFAPENEVFFYCQDRNLERYFAGVLGAYQLLIDAGLQVDFIHPDQIRDGSASAYEALAAPVPYAYPPEVAEGLEKYVREGGTLVAEGFFCAHNPSDGMAATTNPGMGFEAVFGCREGSVSPSAKVGVTASYQGYSIDPTNQPSFVMTASVGKVPAGVQFEGRFAEQRLETTTGAAKAVFADGSAALVENDYEAGRAALIGCWLFQAYHEAPSDEVRELILGLLRLTPSPASSPEVRVDRLVYGNRVWLLLENASPEPVRATVTLTEFVAKVHLMPEESEVPVRNNAFQTDVEPESVKLVRVM